MEALKDIFVPYEIAQKLKEIGFDEKCIASYTKEGKLLIETEEFTRYNFVENLIMENFNLKNRVISAPSYEQVFKWFREKGISSSINPRIYGDLYFYEIFVKENRENKRSLIGNENLNYEECREQLILKLIEIYKSSKL